MEYNESVLKNTGYKIKTPGEIKSQETKSLLRYYKTLHTYTTHGGLCECCQEPYLKIKGTEEENSERLLIDGEFRKYKSFIKHELNSREHVVKKVESTPNPNRPALLLKRQIKKENLYLLSREDLEKYYSKKTQFGKDDVKTFPFGFSFLEVLDFSQNIKHGKKG